MRICPRCQLKYTNEHDKCFVDGTALEQAKDERVGVLLGGKYLVESPLGEGGMAQVYRARHTLVDRPVAIKIMDARFSKDEAMRERFRREAKNAASLAHPNIIEIYDYGETDDGCPYMVMELLEGAPLSELISRGPVPLALATSLSLQIARGIARAHDFQVLHRDLKPDNIFIVHTPDGRHRVKLLDFGIARSMHDPRLTNRGEIFGTPQYMAPERVTSIDAGPTADLYAFGIILFEMVTGRLPFEAQDVTSFLLQHMNMPPPKPSSIVPAIPRRLEELILKLIEKKPENRPVDAHQVVMELAALAPSEERDSVVPVTTAQRNIAPTLPPTTLERWARRAIVFDQMLNKAYPSSDAPPALQEALAEIRGLLGRIQELRSSGLKEQRKLEVIEHSAREGRERLGHAADTLAVDLSQAREAARQAKTGVAPYFDVSGQAEATFRGAYERMRALGVLTGVDAPTPEIAGAMRDAADAVERWLLAHGASEKAHRWVEAKEREVSDLEFQIAALREQLGRVEGQFEGSRGTVEAALRASGREIEKLEQQLMQLATRFCAFLRPRRELEDLFHQLETEGAAA